MENKTQEAALLVPVAPECCSGPSDPFWRAWFFWRLAGYELDAMREAEASTRFHVDRPIVGVRVYGSFQPSPINPVLDQEQTRPYAMMQRDANGNINVRVQARFGTGRIIESALCPLALLVSDLRTAVKNLVDNGTADEAMRWPVVTGHRGWSVAAQEELAKRFPLAAAVFDRLKLAA